MANSGLPELPYSKVNSISLRCSSHAVVEDIQVFTVLANLVKQGQ